VVTVENPDTNAYLERNHYDFIPRGQVPDFDSIHTRFFSNFRETITRNREEDTLVESESSIWINQSLKKPLIARNPSPKDPESDSDEPQPSKDSVFLNPAVDILKIEDTLVVVADKLTRNQKFGL